MEAQRMAMRCADRSTRIRGLAVPCRKMWLAWMTLALLALLTTTRAGVPSLVTDEEGNLHIETPSVTEGTSRVVYINGVDVVAQNAALTTALESLRQHVATLGEPTFATAKLITASFTHPYALARGDMNNDGIMDILFTSLTFGQVGIAYNLGNGSFASSINVVTYALASPHAILVMDTNNDGFKDFLVADADGGSVVAYTNTNPSAGTFSSTVVADKLDAPVSLDELALNKDGFSDFVIATENKDAIYLVQGGSTWSGPSQVVSGTANSPSAFSVRSGDMNNDGYADLVVMRTSADEVALYTGSPTGTFYFSGVLPTLGADYPRAIELGDLDNDGDLDVVLVASISNSVVIMFNQLNGQFSGELVSNSVATPVALHLADLNGDGHLDILTTSFSSQQVVWFRNLGGGRFTNKLILGQGLSQPNSLVALDVDQDGDVDVVATGENANHVVWYENLRL
ncbi:uncharacterized protein MONBRDRAFT_32775 [Monosiga brevicollis MX1]|uniref:VCBS repeat-containing protein n=1 Tax=Monosiga brevicollis TaxID=81824 RepID=A9V1M4_MONBE|nr:uncharacterized protein MONBRDRAFT_32775 [Monosiga brevicollis MX1]EDQ88466.1 predicted protein [Monosiga brevicollis MX1]|eukprot:XP_001746570.1 hypothetical protein [Monosiga brevicollis MX1]